MILLGDRRLHRAVTADTFPRRVGKSSVPPFVLALTKEIFAATGKRECTSDQKAAGELSN